MKKVLVFAYYFPPLGLSGVQRTLAFVKYLHHYGWEPTVITVGDIGYYAHDTEMLKEVQNLGIRVIRTDSFDPHALRKNKRTYSMPSERLRKLYSIVSEIFLIPDSKIGWKHYALSAGTKELSTNSYDCIFSTAPPYTSHVVATALGERFSLPVILDYRDAWVDYPFKRYITPFHFYIHNKMEKKVLESCHHIITAAQSIYRPMSKRYKELFTKKASIISQGFDPEYFSEKSSNNTNNHHTMVITYSGVFYEDRTPEYFLEAVAQLTNSYPSLRAKIKLWFIGVFREEHKKIIENKGLSDIVTLWGYLPHDQCVRLLLQSDILWAMMMDDCSTPGKIFEYIGAQKHILGCVPPHGAMADIILQCNGTVVSPDNAEQIQQSLLSLINKWSEGKLPVVDDETRNMYNREILTKKLSEVLNSVSL